MKVSVQTSDSSSSHLQRGRGLGGMFSSASRGPCLGTASRWGGEGVSGKQKKRGRKRRRRKKSGRQRYYHSLHVPRIHSQSIAAFEQSRGPHCRWGESWGGEGLQANHNRPIVSWTTGGRGLRGARHPNVFCLILIFFIKRK